MGEDLYTSLMTQSLSTVPQFLSVLPANLVVYIFQFLAPADLCAVSAVCRHWRAAAAADALWAVKAKTTWPLLESAKGNRWRDLYVHCSRPRHAHWKGVGKMTLDTLRGHGKAVFCIEATKDRLVTGGDDKKIRLWSVSRRKCTMTLRGHTKAVSAVRQHGDLLLSGGLEGVVRLWEMTGKGKQLRSMDAGDAISSVDFMDKSGFSTCVGGKVCFWDLETGQSTLKLSCNSQVLAGRLDSPQRALWSCADGSIRVCDARTRSETGILLGHTGSVGALQLGRKLQGAQGAFRVSELICSGAADGLIKLWDVRQLKAYSTLSTGEDEVYCVDFDDTVIAAGGKARALHLFDVASEEPIRSLQNHHSDSIHGVSVANSRVFTCSADKTCKILSCQAPATSPRSGSNREAKQRSTPSFLRLTEMFASSSSSSANAAVSSEEK